MNSAFAIDTQQFARCIATSKRIRWEIDSDVIRGRSFDPGHKFLPDGLTLVGELGWLSEHQKRYFSQVQGRTYANMFGLVERFIDAKVLDVSRDHWLGNQTALEALVRFSDEELKHQELFRRVDAMAAQMMPPGYRFDWDPNAVAAVVLSKSSWAVLALTNQIEVFVQAHYRESIGPDENLSDLFKDMFLYHWKEESQHVILGELEWRRIDAGITSEMRDAQVQDFADLIGAVDGILRSQSAADTAYFAATCGRELGPEERAHLEAVMLKAYRVQYIHSGIRHPVFSKVLNDLTTTDQQARIRAALPAIS